MTGPGRSMRSYGRTIYELMAAYWPTAALILRRPSRSASSPGLGTRCRGSSSDDPGVGQAGLPAGGGRRGRSPGRASFRVPWRPRCGRCDTGVGIHSNARSWTSTDSLCIRSSSALAGPSSQPSGTASACGCSRRGHSRPASCYLGYEAVRRPGRRPVGYPRSGERPSPLTPRISCTGGRVSLFFPVNPRG